MSLHLKMLAFGRIKITGNGQRPSQPKEKASFLSENIHPIKESGQLNLLDSTKTPLGFDVLLMDGHTEKQMLPVVNYKGKPLFLPPTLSLQRATCPFPT